MPLFNYSARDIQTGKDRKGLVEAATTQSAVVLLRGQDLVITSLTQKKENELTVDSIFEKFKGVSSGELFTFTREFSTMLSSGLTVTGALRILEAQTTSKYFRSVLQSITRDVEGGLALSKALEKFPKVFDTIYVNLVHSGEISGTLDKVLERLTANLEKDREFKGKLKGALIYPLIIVVMMAGVMGVMLIFVVPKLTSMFVSMGQELPLPTKIMVGLSDFLVNYWWAAIAILIGAIFGLNRFRATALGKHLIDTVIFKLPVFGPLIKMAQLAEFTRDLGLLIGSGIPIIDSLKASRASLTNELLRATIDKAVGSVGRGQTLSSIIASDPQFPMLIPQMLKVGEETGRIDKVLLEVAHYFESESDFAVKNLTAALEPIIMVVLGVGVGVMILSIITPIYKLTSSF